MTDTAAPPAVARTTEPTHREIVEVLIGLLSALFVAILSTTIVSTALPTIIADLDGTQTQYTWVVTASLLAMTVTSPIWSKFSDLYNKKLLKEAGYDEPPATFDELKQVALDGGASRTYVSVDGGMSDNIRTALYDADYSCTLASRESEAPPVLTRVVGKHCEAGDIVVKDEFLPSDIAPGDLVAVPGTGAYCRSMASNYNHALRPPVVAVRDGATRVVVRRETVDDLLATDVGDLK